MASDDYVERLSLEVATDPEAMDAMTYSHIPRRLFDAWFSLLPEAKPFLRWAGGKQVFLSRYGKLLPSQFRKYLEPFLGGGSAFLYVARRQARPFQAISFLRGAE